MNNEFTLRKRDGRRNTRVSEGYDAHALLEFYFRQHTTSVHRKKDTTLSFV